MDESHVAGDLIHVLYTEEQLHGRLEELAREIERDYEGKEILIQGAEYAQGEAVVVDFSCTGAVTCSGSVADGRLLPTAQSGAAFVTVSALDAAGFTG